MALSQTSVLKLYNTVIEDVISGVREAFLDEGVDEQVLQELKQIWETKLISSKAVELNPDPPEPQPPQVIHKTANISKANSNVGNHIGQQSSTGNSSITQQSQQQSQQQAHPHNRGILNQQAIQQPVQQVATAPISVMERQVPIQITLPAQADTQQRVLSIHVPASAIAGNQLQQILTGPIITAAMGLPPEYATTLLQQHVNSTLQGQAGLTAVQVNQPLQVVSQSANNLASQRTVQNQQGNIAQMDGPLGDSSDDDEEEEEEDNDDDDEDLDDTQEEENDDAAAREEEPLNSEDDVTDDDPTDQFETDNVVVCQYDKITRSRNKWKFYLKDGIMNLSGKDFVFQKANGDAEW
ncbi:transcription initiation factor IIA subunit 1 [Belonocnema kinseyi]|uniref:transcription initiation factor IIA subunit 1 n=1 Tax=Belonocnema kinseyi TaxID=2817044 RepID=UPI00143D6906|nr:transcription initiation factor IIA subunit 1 [Belonocnema kinseyi]